MRLDRIALDLGKIPIIGIGGGVQIQDGIDFRRGQVGDQLAGTVRVTIPQLGALLDIELGIERRERMAHGRGLAGQFVEAGISKRRDVVLGIGAPDQVAAGVVVQMDGIQLLQRGFLLLGQNVRAGLPRITHTLALPG